jgi:hypothetical protein
MGLATAGKMGIQAGELGEALPDYIVERELGHGGMGVVFLGHHNRLGRAVAIKELPATFAADPGVRERFSTEARTLASLAHPHIVPIYDYVERDNLCVIVMEELPGGTVWDRFTTTGLTPPAACAIVLACCAALAHAHSKGVLHLDVKPDNLMFAADAAIKVTDFGISRVISGDRTLGTADGQVLGTPAYMSPEQARGSDLTEASDVYSTGVMLYELLSGVLPWSGAETATELLLKRLREAPRPIREVAPHVPPAVANVVMRALEIEPEQRFRHAEQFGVALATACAESWGPAWLDSAGVAIIGSDRLTTAARTTGRQPIATGPVPGAVRTTGDAPATTVTGPIGVDGRVSPETIIEYGTAESDTPTSAPAAQSPQSVPHMPVVRAAGAAPRIEGADFNQIDRAALVDVSEVIGQSTRAKMPLLLAASFVVVGLVASALLFGAPAPTGNARAKQLLLAGKDVTRARPVVDLTKPVSVAARAPRDQFANQATLKLSAAGIPLGSLDTVLTAGKGQFLPSGARFVASGSVTARLEIKANNKVLTHEQFAATVDRPFYLAGFGIGSILLLLAGFAYYESSLRPLRRGRRSIAGFVGCALSGAVMAVGVAGVVAASGHLDLTASGLVASALAAAGTGVAVAVAIRRRGLAKGVKRAVKRAQTSFNAQAAAEAA